ncbi:MAG: glycine cleavage system aminomethyltransferase GcvT [Myxococcota bacterium]
MSSLQRTPLHDRHVELGARMVEFAGFSMPVQYRSILEEHAAVRERAGIFDVSHMGQLHLSGPGAVRDAERLVSCRVDSLRPGRIRYGLLCNERGGVVDDVTVYRESDDALMLCVNAANIDKDREWVRSHLGSDTQLEDRSAETGLLALQGPQSAAILEALVPGAAGIKRFRFEPREGPFGAVWVSRTGYTGSDGFEIYAPAEHTVELFDALLDAGRSRGLTPSGLGARDTLRLEAALPLYGHELDDDTSPLAAGLERFVKRDIGGFIGAEALERRAADGHPQVLAGLVIEGRGIAREGHEIARDGATIGRVTSGAPSPTLGQPIALGYVPPDAAVEGSALEVLVRSRSVAARVVATPFVARPAAASATT